MESSIWNALSAIGQCCGAAATLLAVGVALYESQRVSRPVVEVLAESDFAEIEQRQQSIIKVVATNTGFRPVRIMSLSIVYPDKSQEQIPVDNTVLPTILEQSQQVPVEVPAEYVASILRMKQSNSRLNPSESQVKLKFIFRDSYHKQYHHKLVFDMNELEVVDRSGK